MFKLPLKKSNISLLKELAKIFLKLGTTAFGGPVAHIAMMENEFVKRRNWFSKEEFLNMLGAVNLIPGPNSTEMAIYIGYRQAGLAGLLIAGICFIGPAVLIVLTLAWAYTKFGTFPQAVGILYGIKPVIIAIIFQALWSLSKTALKTRFLYIICLLSIAATLGGINILLILIGSGILSLFISSLNTKFKEAGNSFRSVLNPFSISLAASNNFQIVSTVEFSFVNLSSLFFIFLKIGAVLFGSGYVLLAFLRTDLVEHYHWLTDKQLLDAIAIGQFTPGPVFTTATFIGYLLLGVKGAFVATIGIFLPAFVLIAISGTLIPWLRKSSLFQKFLDGVNVASLALMTVVTWQLAKSALIDIPTLILAGISILILSLTKMNSIWLILLGAIVGTIKITLGF